MSLIRNEKRDGSSWLTVEGKGQRRQDRSQGQEQDLLEADLLQELSVDLMDLSWMGDQVLSRHYFL